MLRGRWFALLLVVVFSVSMFTGTALAHHGPFFSGKFGTKNIKWFFNSINLETNSHNPPANYRTETSDAIADWDTTNLTLTNSTAYQVVIGPTNAGQTGSNGWAVHSGGPTTYTGCQAYINNTYTSGWHWDPIESLILHETGHCWGLAHDNADAASVMREMINGYNWTNRVPSADDKSSVNTLYP